MSSAPEIHIADLYEALADTIGQSPAIIQGTRTVTWEAFDDRAARLASFLAAQGVGQGH